MFILKTGRSVGLFLFNLYGYTYHSNKPFQAYTKISFLYKACVTANQIKQQNMWKQIFKATLIAGCLDITAACTQAWLAKSITPDVVLKYIASGVFGKDAFAGGTGMILSGLLFHFIIAFACTLVYFLAYPKIKVLHVNIFLSSLFIAFIAWAVTTQLLIPLTKIKPGPFNLTKAITAIAILYVCIGLPVSYFTKRYYNNTK
jgi:hypothetical protein